MPVIKLGHPEPTWFHGLLKYLPPWINDFTLTTVFIVLLLSTLAWLGTRSLRKRGISRGQAVWELVGVGLMHDHQRPLLPLHPVHGGERDPARLPVGGGTIPDRKPGVAPS